MLPNSKMKEGRFLKWARARKKVAWIKDQLGKGRMIQVTTYLRATRYTEKHAEMFKAGRDGVYVQRGKNWDFISGCDIRAF